MVTAEDYTWQFAGAWGPPAPDEQPRPLPLKPVQQNVPTNVPQLLGAPEWVSGQSTPTIPGLAPRNNEVAWTLPASAEEAKAAFAPMTATVSGRATIATRTRGSEGWKDERESGSGELSFIVELW
jgi:hypothetical protein